MGGLQIQRGDTLTAFRDTDVVRIRFAEEAGELGFGCLELVVEFAHLVVHVDVVVFDIGETALQIGVDDSLFK